MTALAPTLQTFFTDRLMQQRQVSPHTIAAYRDTFRLLLSYAAAQTGKKPHHLDLADLDAPLIGRFLQHLDSDRHNSPRTRNARLAAIDSLFNYASLRHPEHAATIQRVLTIAPHRFERNLVTFLTEPEADALLASCDLTSRTGRRDHTMLLLAIQTGLHQRTQLPDHRRHQPQPWTARPHHRQRPQGTLHLAAAPHRLDPEVLAHRTRRRARRAAVLDQHRQGAEPRRRRAPHRALPHPGTDTLPVLQTKKITAHTLRHTAAMRLLVTGVDVTVIALWLGHEQVSTTNIYLHADMTQKERALARVTPPKAKPGRYQATDTILAFLDKL